MSHMVEIASDAARAARMSDLKIADEKAAKAREKAHKNTAFTQVTPLGWKRLQHLIKEHPPLARLYAFLAEHIDGHTGTVVCSQEFLAKRLDVHMITIRRQTKQLENIGAIVRIRVGNGVYAYALNPEEIWKSWADKKDTAAFVTRTLVDKRDVQNNTVMKKLKTFYVEK